MSSPRAVPTVFLCLALATCKDDPPKATPAPLGVAKIKAMCCD